MNSTIKLESFYFEHVYGFLFVFTSICRQFLFAKVLDLRYLTLFLGIFLILRYFLHTGQFTKIVIKKCDIGLILYYIFAVVSNLKWFSNRLTFNEEGFKKLLVLMLFNVCGILTFGLCLNFYNNYLVWRWIHFSCIVLSVSMIAAYLGVDMVAIWGTGRKGANLISESTNLTRNILGQNIRAAGYAEDPNYATLFMLLGIISTFVICKNVFHKIVSTSLFLLGIILANSNTVIISILVATIVVFIIYRVNRSEKPIILGLFFTLMILVFFLPYFRIGDSLTTLHSRYDMWNNAMALFLMNPLLGNGWTAFRSFHTWYVHCHNTYWEILCENGIFALFFYLSYYYRTIIQSEIALNKYILIVYFIFCMMFDMSYMQIGIVLIYLLPKVR